MPRVRGQSRARSGRGRSSRGRSSRSRGRRPAAATSAATSEQGGNRRLSFSAEPAPVTSPTPSTSRDVFTMELEKVRQGVAATKRRLSALPKEVRKEYDARKVAKQTERVLLPDAPPRKRTSRKQSPERKVPRLTPGTPSVPPPPKPQPWQRQQPTTSMTATPTVRETTPSLGTTPGNNTTSSHVSYDSVIEVPGFSPLRVDWSTGNLVGQTSLPWRCRSPLPGPSSAPLASPLPAVSAPSESATLASPLPTVSNEQQSSHCGLYEDDDARLDAWQRQLDEASIDSDSDADEPRGHSRTDHNYSLRDFNTQEEDLEPELQQWLAQNDAQSDSHLHTMVPVDYLSFDWNNDPNSFRGQREEFTGSSGPTFTLNENDRPLDIFKRFFTDALLDLIVHETNRYANQMISKSRTPSSRLSRWTPTDRGEIAIFLAIIMFQGAAPLTCEIDYFRENGYLTLKYFNSLMTYDRYKLLTRLLHFSNNDDIPTDMTKDEKKFKKIHPILSYLNTKFSTLYLPLQNIAIDESLLKWHGRLGFAQKIATKAAKVGIKSYELCESSTGYLWTYYIYTGKQTKEQIDEQTDQQTDEPPIQTDELRPPPPTGATSKIVNELARPLFGRGHTLVMDNFYNSPLLARYLKSQGTDCFGTLRVNREFVPEGLKRMNKSDLRSGELLQSYSHDLSIVMWRDSNLVSMISTYYGGQVGGKEKYGTYKYKPQVVLDYNNTMGGVDRKDQLLSAHPMERTRGHSWYKKLFRHILNTTILNSLIIFHTKNARITQRDFRRQLAESLVETYRPTQRIVDVEQLPRVLERQRPILRGNHFVALGPSKYKVCTMCHKARTKYICE